MDWSDRLVLLFDVDVFGCLYVVVWIFGCGEGLDWCGWLVGSINCRNDDVRGW